MKRTSSSLQLMTIDSTPSTSSEDDIESDAETRKADPSHKETSRGAVSIDKPAVFERKYCSPRMKMLTKGVGQGPRTSDLQAVVKVWRRGENGMKTMTRKQQKQQVEIDPFTATCSACSRPINGSVFMFQGNFLGDSGGGGDTSTLINLLLQHRQSVLQQFVPRESFPSMLK